MRKRNNPRFRSIIFSTFWIIIINSIITTNIPGCKETVEEGRNGYLVPPRDVEALVGAIRKFLNLSLEERQRMGEYGRKKAEREFDVKNVIAIYREITG